MQLLPFASRAIRSLDNWLGGFALQVMNGSRGSEKRLRYTRAQACNLPHGACWGGGFLWALSSSSIPVPSAVCYGLLYPLDQALFCVDLDLAKSGIFHQPAFTFSATTVGLVFNETD